MDKLMKLGNLKITRSFSFNSSVWEKHFKQSASGRKEKTTHTKNYPHREILHYLLRSSVITVPEPEIQNDQSVEIVSPVRSVEYDSLRVQASESRQTLDFESHAQWDNETKT